MLTYADGCSANAWVPRRLANAGSTAHALDAEKQKDRDVARLRLRLAAMAVEGVWQVVLCEDTYIQEYIGQALEHCSPLSSGTERYVRQSSTQSGTE